MSFNTIKTSNQNPNPEDSLTGIFRSMLLAPELPHEFSEFFTSASEATKFSAAEISVVLSTSPPPGPDDNKLLYLRIVNNGSDAPRVMTSSLPFKCPQHILIRTEVVVSSGTPPISILDVIQVNSNKIDPATNYPRFRFLKSARPASPQMFNPLADLNARGSAAFESASKDFSEMKENFLTTNTHVRDILPRLTSTITNVQESIQAAINKMLEMVRCSVAGVATIMSVTGAAVGILYLANTWYEDFKLRVATEPGVSKAEFLRTKASNVIKTLLKCGAAALVASIVLVALSPKVRKHITSIATAMTKLSTDFMSNVYDHVVGVGNRLADRFLPSKPLGTWNLIVDDEDDDKTFVNYKLHESVNKSDTVYAQNNDYLRRYVNNCQLIIKSLSGHVPFKPDDAKELMISHIGRHILKYMKFGGTYRLTGNTTAMQGGFIIKHSLNPSLVTLESIKDEELKFLRGNFSTANNTSPSIKPYKKFLFSLRRLTLAITDPLLAKPSILEYMGLTNDQLYAFLDVGLAPYANSNCFPYVEFDIEDDESFVSGEDSATDEDDEATDVSHWGSDTIVETWQGKRPELSLATAQAHVDSTSSDSEDETTASGGDASPQMGVEHGLTSFLALSYALFQFYATPDVPISTHLAALRKNSMTIGVGMTAATFLTQAIPDSLRYAAYNKLGFGAPSTLSPKQKALVSNAFLICAHLRVEANQTIPNKREFDFIYHHLCTVMGKHASSWSAPVRAFFNTAKKDMQAVSVIANAIADQNPIKPVPVGLWLWGKPASGKSTMIQNIAKILYDHVLPSERVYPFDESSAYWDGYTRQKILLYDDIGSDPTATAENGVFANLLGHMSSSPSTVSGADVAHKGTPFTSEMVVLTSNVAPNDLLRQISNKGRLTNPDAVLRRFNNSTGISVEVVLKEDYKMTTTDGKVIGNSVAIAAAAARNPMRTTWCTYRLSTGAVLNFKGLLELIVVQLSRSKLVYRSMCNHLNDQVSEDFDCVRGLNAINAIVDCSQEMQFKRCSPGDPQMFCRSATRRRKRSARLNMVKQFQSELRDWDRTQTTSALRGVMVLDIEHFKKARIIRIKDAHEGEIRDSMMAAFEAALKLRADRILTNTAPGLFEHKTVVEQKTGGEDQKQETGMSSTQILKCTENLGIIGKHIAELAAEHKFDDSLVSEYQEELLADYLSNPVEVDDEFKKMLLEELSRRTIDMDHPIGLFSFCYTAVEQAATKNWKQIQAWHEQVVSKATGINWILAAKVLASVVSVAGVLFAAWRMFSADTTVFQSRDPGKDEKLPPHARSKFTARPTMHNGRAVNALHQMAGSHYVPVANLEAINRIKKNLVKFSPHPEFNERHFGSGLFVSGRTILMQAHYVTGLSPEESIECTIICGEQVYASVVHFSDVTVLSKNGHKGDMILWTIPTGTGFKAPNPRKNIVNLFTTQASVESHSYTYATNYGASEESTRQKVINRLNNDLTVETIPQGRITSTPVKLTAWLEEGVTERVHALRYPRSCKAGECGSITIFNGQIIGIHTAGYGQKTSNNGIECREISVSNVVTRDILNALLSSQRQGIEREQSSLLGCFSPEQDDGVLHPLKTFGRVPETAEANGNVRGSMGPRLTKYVETRMLQAGSTMAADCHVEPTSLSHEGMPPELKLNSYADFLVYIHGLKNAHACQLLDPTLLTQCFSRLIGRVVPIQENGNSSRVWSLHEALNPSKCGFPLSHLALSTSAGYGSAGVGKHAYIYFDEEKEAYIPYPKLEELIQLQLAKIDEYVLPFQPFTVSPKDECRKLNKLTRIIDITTIDMTILARMGFWQFITAWHSDPIAYGHVIGLAVHQGVHWSEMLSSLNEMSPDGFGGDIKSFDGLFSQQAWVTLSECIESWYKEHRLWTLEGAKIRAAVLLNICCSTHIAGDRVYTFGEHMPSGSPLTTIANTLWSAVLLMYSFASLAPTRGVPLETINGTLHNFENFVRNYACGDDNITAVSSTVGDWYNAANVAEFLETIGVTYTPPQKNVPHPIKNQPLSAIEFLSCVSVSSEVPGVLFSPWINAKSMTKSVRWVRRSNVKCEAESVADNLNMVLQRAFWSGKERMDLIRSDLVYHFSKAYPHYINPRPFDSYEDTMADFGLGRVQQYAPAELQMMATAVPSANSIVDEQPVTMTAGGGSPTTKGYITKTPQNVITLCRRTHPIHSFDETTSISKVYDVAALFGSWWASSGTYTDLNYTAIHKISTFFRTWGGCPNIILHLLEGSGDIAFKPLNHEGGEASFYDAKNGTPAAGNTATCYPTAVGTKDGWGVSGVISQQTRFTCFKIKHFSSDDITECSPGSVHMRVRGNAAGAFAYNFGDGTDLAVPFAVPMIFVGKVVAPDQYSTLDVKEPANFQMGCEEDSESYYEPADLQGISYSSQNIKAVQSQGITTSTTNDFENEVDAKVHGNDAPNQFVSLGALLRQPSQYIASGVRFDTNPALAITPGLVPADMTTVSSSSDTSITSVAKMTMRTSVELKSSFAQGYVLWDGPITPTGSIMSLTSPGQMVQPTALGAVSAMFAFWRGSIKLSVQAVMSGVHTCRLGVAILYGKFSVPTGGITALTSQRFFSFELSAENRTGSVEIPYVAKTPLLETWRGQVTANPNTYASGHIVIFVLNELRGPAAASTSIDLIVSEGPGHDFELLSPLTVNQSLRYIHEDGKAPPVIFSDPEEVAVPQMMQQGGSDAPNDANISAPESKGVVYADSSQTVESGVQSGTTNTTDAGGFIAMPQFTAITMLEREQLLTTTTWNTSDAINTSLFAASVPNELFLYVAAKARNMFQYYHMTTHIAIKVQATAFHSGRLIAFHVPMTNKVDFDRVFLGTGSAYPGIERRTNQTYTDHVFLDVSTSASSELVMPWRNIQPYIEEFEEQARFCLSVFTPLRVGTGGSNTVPISITVKFTDASMKVLNPF